MSLKELVDCLISPTTSSEKPEAWPSLGTSAPLDVLSQLVQYGQWLKGQNRFEDWWVLFYVTVKVIELCDVGSDVQLVEAELRKLKDKLGL